LRLLSVLLPVCLASNSVTSYELAKGFGFFAGFAFFGDPVIMRALAFLNQNYPGWHKLLHFEKYDSDIFTFRLSFTNESKASFSEGFRQMLN